VKENKPECPKDTVLTLNQPLTNKCVQSLRKSIRIYTTRH
jgi:hypothetical protein